MKTCTPKSPVLKQVRQKHLQRLCYMTALKPPNEIVKKFKMSVLYVYQLKLINILQFRKQATIQLQSDLYRGNTLFKLRIHLNWRKDFHCKN